MIAVILHDNTLQFLDGIYLPFIILHDIWKGIHALDKQAFFQQ